MASIPLTFEPHDWDRHLAFKETAGIVEARWAALGMSVCYPKLGEFKVAPSRAEVATHTPQLKFHGHNGYSLGRYTELFVFPGAGVLMEYQRPDPVSFSMGPIDGSLGQATPLSHFLFHNTHDDDFEGEFSSFFSLRLMGVSHESAETVALSAMLLLGRELGLNLRPARVGGDFAADTAESEAAVDESDGVHEDARSRATVALPNGFSEVEPLRMLLGGRDEPTPEIAFLQLYRVLEYFSILCNEEKAAAMRADTSLPTRRFLLELQQVIAKDEKAALARLISEVADGRVLALAKADGLVEHAKDNALTNALYDFRNSVVHAKEDRGAPLFTQSIFAESTTAGAWKRVCELLAWKAMERYGLRLG